MSDSPTRLSVVAGDSTSADPEGAVPENTLIVAEYPGENEERIYWKGKRLNGTIDHTQPMARSNTHPHFTMLIDGQPVVFGSGGVDDTPFVFRGETLYVHGGGFKIDYDAKADCPVF